MKDNGVLNNQNLNVGRLYRGVCGVVKENRGMYFQLLNSECESLHRDVFNTQTCYLDNGGN